MKKLIPVLVVFCFLIVGLCSNNIDFEKSINTSSDDLPTLPDAEPTVLVEKNEENVDRSGTRFKVTTETSIFLNSPKPFQNYSKGDIIEVSGRLFEDNNTNGIFDTGQDIPVQEAKVRIEFGDNYVLRETAEDGTFEWSVTNDMTVKGVWDMKITYDGQYTINGTEWYDVNTDPDKGNGILGFNEDNDFYIDVGYDYDPVGDKYSYNFTTGDGKFTPGKVNVTLGKRLGGDPILRDTGARQFRDTWDSGDNIVKDPLRDGDMSSDDTLMQHYENPGTPGRVDFTDALIDEETPNTLDQVSIYQYWADDDGDWDINSHDVGEDGQGGSADTGEGDGWPTPGVSGDPTKPGEPYVDEDLNFTKFRKESNVTIWLALWHNTQIDAVILNSTGKQTNKVIVGEEITIQGTLKNMVNPSLRPANKPLKIKVFGTFLPGLVWTKSKGDFSKKYVIPEHPMIRVGKRDIDIIFDEAIYDPFFNQSNNSHEFILKTSLSTQSSGPISLRIYRPIHIDFDQSKYIGYRFKSLIINGSILDDNDRALTTNIVNDDGSTETITTNAYKVKFEWGRPGDNYYKYREEELLDASGNFSITKIQINHPEQSMGDIPVTITFEANESQTYYLSIKETINVLVRSKGGIELWIDQDKDGFINEDYQTKKGPLADYITREKHTDKDGNEWHFNKVIVYGRLYYKERYEDGINDMNVQYYWEDDDLDYADNNYITVSRSIDQNVNNRIEDNEKGMFRIPDPYIIQNPIKQIEPSDPLGPIILHVKFDDPGEFIDPIEIVKEFNIVAMTEIEITPGSGIKGKNLTVNGRLLDDRNIGVKNQDIRLYWEDLQGDLLDGDKFDPIKLADAEIGNITTDVNGYFTFTSEKVLKSDVDVGKGYVVAIYDGMDTYIGSQSGEIPFSVSSHTRLEMDASSKNLELIRGRPFEVEGTIFEEYKGDKNLETKVILGIADADQMELYIKNYDELAEEIQIKDIRVEYKSEGKFTVSGTIPYNLEVGTATLRVVFKGSKNGNYLESEETTFQEIWADTIIKILAPRVREKEIEEEGYVLQDDLKQEKYDIDSEDFEEELIFRFQILEKTESQELKPVPEGKVTLTINSTFSVFTNKSIIYFTNATHPDGIVEFKFGKPLKDTDWGYTLAQKDPEELLISVEFSGSNYYLPSKALPIQTTHWPPDPGEDKGWWDREENQIYIWSIVIVIIVFLIVFFFAMQWYNKQQRIRGMRRIIKRAADQLIAGNEYQAVIFKSYQKLGVHLRKYGYLRRESETFREFEDAVRRALPIDRMSMDKFLILLEEARYSSHQIGERQRNDAILNLRAIERSLDRIIIDENAALRALERLEEEGVKDTKILVGQQPTGQKNVPQLLKGAGPGKPGTPPKGPGGSVK